jgi:hypothetical protein
VQDGQDSRTPANSALLQGVYIKLDVDLLLLYNEQLGTGVQVNAAPARGKSVLND